MDEFYEEPFDEYGDLDAIACANGDYNTFEENEVFRDHEGFDELEDQYLDSSWEDRYELDYHEMDYLD